VGKSSSTKEAAADDPSVMIGVWRMVDRYDLGQYTKASGKETT
jgi:hypothetical protein